MKPEEINKKAYEKYPVKMNPDDDTMGFTSTDVNEAARNGYIEAYKEISALPTIKGWVARDKCGELYFFKERPTRSEYVWSCPVCSCRPIKDKKVFPDLRWEDEPIEVELPIIRM